MEKAKVFFTKEISSEKVVEIYKLLNKDLKGNVAVKVHSGEAGNQNYLRPEFMKQIIDYVNGTVVECNTAYEGERNVTEKHKRLMENHGWSKYFNVDILDSDGEEILENPNGEIIKKNLEDIGISVNIVNAKDWNYENSLKNKNYDMLITRSYCSD